MATPPTSSSGSLSSSISRRSGDGRRPLCVLQSWLRRDAGVCAPLPERAAEHSRARAYEWLSRGLLEALVAFLGRAGAVGMYTAPCTSFSGPRRSQRGQDRLKLRGAKVRSPVRRHRVVRQEWEAAGPWERNRDAIARRTSSPLPGPRTHGKLMHNKFFVLSQNGQPKAVWTGSTNLTENGIFGHSNVGHIVEDAAIAQPFLDYWDRLRATPRSTSDYRSANVLATATPPHPWNAVTTAVFSPRGTEPRLRCTWYARDRRRRETRPVHDLRVWHAPEVQGRLPTDDSRPAHGA